jgi:hypothetical protein
MPDLYQSVWDHEILCANGSSEDEEILTRQFLWKSKDTNVEGGWKLKSIFCRMDVTRERLKLDKLTVKITKMHKKFYFNYCFVWRSF